MKKTLFFVLISMGLAFSLKAVSVKEENAPLFKYNTCLGVKDNLPQGQNLLLLKQGAECSKVKTILGDRGWMLNNTLMFIPPEKADTHVLKPYHIKAFRKYLQTVPTHLPTEPAPEVVMGDRSFLDEVFEYQDRENIERSNDEN